MPFHLTVAPLGYSLFTLPFSLLCVLQKRVKKDDGKAEEEFRLIRMEQRVLRRWRRDRDRMRLLKGDEEKG